MARIRKILIFSFVVGFLLGAHTAYGYLSFGQTAPSFSLKDTNDQSYDLSALKERPMIVLYFFDVDSKPSQDGLLSLNQLSKQYKGNELIIWAITLSPKEKANSFAKTNHLSFPILFDKSGVSTQYQAQQILPTVCIIGPNLKILNYIQGGGKTTEIMLVSLAERELQRKQTHMAKAISNTISQKYPQNMQAKAIKGHALIAEGKLKDAENVFGDLSRKSGKAGVIGKEGLAKVYIKKGQPEKALPIIQEVEQKDPDRDYPHVLKSDILAAQNKRKEATDELEKAISKKSDVPYLETEKYNKLGVYYAKEGKHSKARELYNKTIEIDPLDIEGTTNKGIAYEKEGNLDKALESYRQALAMNSNDMYARVLAKRAQEMLDIQKDAERSKRVNQLVKDLAERYRSQKKTAAKVEDEWTSQPMILTFIDFQEKGIIPERDGFSDVLIAQLTDSLNASGRVKVVERALIERLLEELNLGTSDLANPETALRLGKILAAKLIGTGSLYYMPQGTTLNLRLIETETSSISQTTTRQMDAEMSTDKALLDLNREILKNVIMKYPLRGFLAKVKDDEVVINLGAKQGVVTGTKFDVLGEQEAIQYKGKTLKSSPKTVAQLEVTRAEPDLSFAKIVKKERPLVVDDKVQEKIEETFLR
jgi:tetratricopeptide (TPR) repeat protein/peroxiredoxin